MWSAFTRRNRRWQSTSLVIPSFFFSSRRRHTRYIGDWSSDVCSSDLAATGDAVLRVEVRDGQASVTVRELPSLAPPVVRSEERRVGKERRCGWGQVSVRREHGGAGRGVRRAGALEPARGGTAEGVRRG